VGNFLSEIKKDVSNRVADSVSLSHRHPKESKKVQIPEKSEQLQQQ